MCVFLYFLLFQRNKFSYVIIMSNLFFEKKIYAYIFIIIIIIYINKLVKRDKIETDILSKMYINNFFYHNNNNKNFPGKQNLHKALLKRC